MIAETVKKARLLMSNNRNFLQKKYRRTKTLLNRATGKIPEFSGKNGVAVNAIIFKTSIF